MGGFTRTPLPPPLPLRPPPVVVVLCLLVPEGGNGEEEEEKRKAPKSPMKAEITFRVGGVHGRGKGL